MKKKLTNDNPVIYCPKCQQTLDLRKLLSLVHRVHDDFCCCEYLDELEVIEVLTDCRFHKKKYKV
jgi:hypothetical protein